MARRVTVELRKDYIFLVSLVMMKSSYLLAACIIGLALFAALFMAVVGGAASILRIDAAVREFALARPLYWFWSTITQFGGPVILIILIAAAMFLLRKRRQDLVLFCGVTAVGFVLNIVFKAAAGRLRPDQVAGVGNSFPSGHTLMATVVYGSLLVILWRNPSWKWKKALWLLPVLIILVAWSRVMVGAHWLSDIAGGLCLGVGIVAGVLFLQGFIGQWAKKAKSARR